MASALEIQQVRWEVQDVDPGLPILPDDTYSYVIDKNQGNIRRAALDAARMILFKLSIEGDQTVDIFSIKGAKAAEQYREALKLFLRDSNLNPALTLAQGYAGGVDAKDFVANLQDRNNVAVIVPSHNPDSIMSAYDPLGR